MDGGQHFKQVSNWKSPDESQKMDVHKMKLANQYNYSVIRIDQEDVWNDKNNWKKNLLKAIKKYDEPINIFIGDIYSLHPKYKSVYDENESSSEWESSSSSNEWSSDENTLFDGYSSPQINNNNLLQNNNNNAIVEI